MTPRPINKSPFWRANGIDSGAGVLAKIGAMHFSIVFSSHESYDLSYSLLFVPCPVWQQGDREIVNLHREDPHYRPGDLRVLLGKEQIEQRLEPGSRCATVIVQPTGEGERADLLALLGDLMTEGFTVNMMSFGRGA